MSWVHILKQPQYKIIHNLFTYVVLQVVWINKINCFFEVFQNKFSQCNYCIWCCIIRNKTTFPFCLFIFSSNLQNHVFASTGIPAFIWDTIEEPNTWILTFSVTSDASFFLPYFILVPFLLPSIFAQNNIFKTVALQFQFIVLLFEGFVGYNHRGIDFSRLEGIYQVFIQRKACTR